MECIKCGVNNEQQVESCQGCGIVLSTLEYGEDGAAHPVYDRYVEFRKAVTGHLAGQVTDDDFKRFVDEISFKMAQKEQEIRELEIPPDAIEDFRDELMVGFEGIDLYNQALAHLRQYASTKDITFARSGLALAWAGNEKINEARRINRQARGEGGEEAVSAE